MKASHIAALTEEDQNDYDSRDCGAVGARPYSRPLSASFHLVLRRSLLGSCTSSQSLLHSLHQLDPVSLRNDTYANLPASVIQSAGTGR